MKPTPCEDCDGVVASTRKDGPYRWLCIRFPRLPGLDPVAPTQRMVFEPYMRCAGINGGHCPLWSPRREPVQKEAAE
jgi:hypothetical protein